MMHGMASCAIDDRRVGNILTVMNEDGPDIDEAKKRDVCELLQGEQEGENVIWYRLCEAIEWMEGVAGVWRWHDPFVVWLV